MDEFYLINGGSRITGGLFLYFPVFLQRKNISNGKKKKTKFKGKGSVNGKIIVFFYLHMLNNNGEHQSFQDLILLITIMDLVLEFQYRDLEFRQTRKFMRL